MLRYVGYDGLRSLQEAFSVKDSDSVAPNLLQVMLERAHGHVQHLAQVLKNILFACGGIGLL